MRLYILISLILFTTSAFAADYYIDFTDGNDSNDGLAPGSAWKNITKVEGHSCTTGDDYYFQCGERWDITADFDINCSGTASNYSKYSSYGCTGSNAKPIIDGINTVTGWDTAGNWTDNDGGSDGPIWYMTLSQNPGRIWLSSVEYLDAAGVTGVNGIDSSYRWFWQSSTNRLYVYATSNPASFYSLVEGKQGVSPLIDWTGKDYVLLEGLDLRGGRVATINMNGTIGGIIRGNEVTYGGYGIQLHCGGTNNSNKYGIVEGNNVDAMFTIAVGYDDAGTTDGIELRDGNDYMIIRNNTVKNFAHVGIVMKDTDDRDCSGVRYTQVYGNYVTAIDIFDGKALATYGLDGYASYNEVYQNVFNGLKNNSQPNGSYNWFHDNIWSNHANTDTGSGVAIGISGSLAEPTVAENNIYENNTFYNIDGYAFIVDQQASAAATKQGLIFRNNICYECGNNPDTAANNDIAFEVEVGSNVGSNTYQNNLCYSSGNNCYRYNETNMNAASFNAQNGSDGNTISNNLMADPLFVSQSDYRLTSSSPAIDAGIAADTFNDFNGIQRPQNGIYDLGAFEYGGGKVSRGVILTGIVQ